MHFLQPRQSKLKKEDVDKLLIKFNISLSQLPKMSKKDHGIPEGVAVGDVVKFEVKTEQGTDEYFRVVV